MNPVNIVGLNSAISLEDTFRDLPEIVLKLLPILAFDDAKKDKELCEICIAQIVDEAIKEGMKENDINSIIERYCMDVSNPYFENSKTEIALRNSPRINSLLKQLKRIDPEAELIEVPAILEIKTGLSYQKITLKSSINTITGKAKSRKSFFLLILIATILKTNYENMRSIGEGILLYFDTEQGEARTIINNKRLQKMVGIDLVRDNLITYDLRKFTPNERMDIIQYLIENTANLKAVFVDGLKDLGTDINSLEESTTIVSKFLKLTSEYNFALFTNLHENPGNEKVRGHLGTEMINKSEVVFGVEKYTHDNNLSLVSAKFIRERDFEPFLIGIENSESDIEAIPYVVDEKPINTDKSSNKRKPEFWDIADETHKAVLKNVFAEKDKIIFSDLVSLLQFQYASIDNFGINKIQKFIPLMKDKGWIKQDKERGPYTSCNGHDVSL